MSVAFAYEYDEEVYARPVRQRAHPSFSNDATLTSADVQIYVGSLPSFSDDVLLNAQAARSVAVDKFRYPLANTITNVVRYEVGQKLISKKLEIQKLIETFVGDDSVFAPNTISQNVAEAAKKFLDLLPLNKTLPKVEADGEGAMMFLWTHQEKHLLVLVETDRLHMAINAASPEANYVSDIHFDGNSLPGQLIDRLPG